MTNRRWLSTMLIVVLLAVSVLPCYGASTQEKLSDARAEQAATQSQLDSIQDRISELNSKKGQSEAYLTELNTQLTQLADRLADLQSQYDAKQEELVQVQQELLDARAAEEEQYEAMKLRIQYIYENSNGNGYMGMLLASENISDLINRAEYIQRISDYDRDMLDTYKQTVQNVRDKEQQVLTEQQAIAELQKQSEEQQAAIQELYAAAYQELRAYMEQLDSAKSSQSELLNEISRQEEQINSLIRQAKEEEIAARKKAEEEAARKAAAERAAQEAREAEQRRKEESAKADSGKKNTSGDSSPKTPAASGSSSQSAPEPSSPSKGNSSTGTYLGTFRLTGYCSCSACCGQWAGHGTASGTTPTPGRTVAMGGVPFGTKLLINGQVYIVEDRGTAYGHVDIFFGSHGDAIGFGMQYAEVYQID